MRMLLVCSVATLLFSAGCREGLGKHCTETSDCVAGLACILPVGGTPQTGGVCSTLDAGVAIEEDFGSFGDGGSDGGDAGIEDFGTDDLLEVD